MRYFPDTSFLCSLYRRQIHSPQAIAWMEGQSDPLNVSGLLLLEFRQSVRLQIKLNSHDKSRGFSDVEGNAILRDLQSDLTGNILEIVPVDWPNVHRLAEGLSDRFTVANGHRLIDILHVATALHFGVRDFLTFDANQKKLAQLQGMKVPLLFSGK